MVWGTGISGNPQITTSKRSHVFSSEQKTGWCNIHRWTRWKPRMVGIPSRIAMAGNAYISKTGRSYYHIFWEIQNGEDMTEYFVIRFFSLREITRNFSKYFFVLSGLDPTRLTVHNPPRSRRLGMIPYPSDPSVYTRKHQLKYSNNEQIPPLFRLQTEGPKMSKGRKPQGQDLWHRWRDDPLTQSCVNSKPTL